MVCFRTSGGKRAFQVPQANRYGSPSTGPMEARSPRVLSNRSSSDMTALTIGMISSVKGLIVLCAFLTILYFAVMLCQAKVPGSRFLLAGGVAVLVGSVAHAGVWNLGLIALWLAWFLDSIGALAAAYGFARVTRATITQYQRRQ